MAGLSEPGFTSVSPIFLLPTNLSAEEVQEIEDAVYVIGGRVSHDPTEARIFVGQITQKKRAAFELRSRGVWTKESTLPAQHPRKRRKLNPDGWNDSSSVSGAESSGEGRAQGSNVEGQPDIFSLLSGLEDHIVVLKVQWLRKSLDAGSFLSAAPYLVYTGQKVAKPEDETAFETSRKTITYIKAGNSTSSPSSLTAPNAAEKEKSSLTDILDGANLGSQAQAQAQARPHPVVGFSPRRFRDQRHGPRTTLSPSHPPLKRTTTSEQDFIASADTAASLAPPPAWMQQPHPRANYACTRSTLANPPNEAFISHLYKIREARLLTLDEIGVRAYSTSIASLSAYPHKIKYPAEITRLPGCSEKIASLWVEWYTSADPDDPDSERHLQVTDELEKNEDLRHLKLFYDIWGVGADTARKFYYEKGWKDIDDIVEYGWHTGALNRVQQIGVKFYDDFLVKLPREGVEEIADIILLHARSCRGIPESCWSNKKNGYKGNWDKPDDGRGDPAWDPRDMVCVIVGGYRRGKQECGDVDVILSHRDENFTKDLVVDVVKSLEDEGWITHTLTLHTPSSDRGQQTLPYNNATHVGHRFDTLDKALCVWQDPSYDGEKHEKNPNIHRRVDIIVSPWRTVGAAVLGWSGATTFERDVRVWCRKERGWKFDSSGIRDRASGAVLDLESARLGRNGRQREGEVVDDADGWEDRERRLMEGLGIGWRPATERCTG